MVLPRKGQMKLPWLSFAILGILTLVLPWPSVWAAGEPVLTQ